jgi:integrase/recombinase XerD
MVNLSRNNNAASALIPQRRERRKIRLPPIIIRAGKRAEFAAKEFLGGKISNEHTERAYTRAIMRFLAWSEQQGLELIDIEPWHVGDYMKTTLAEKSIPTRKQNLAALRHFFDNMVVRHAMILNPALSVRGDRYSVLEGKRSAITVVQARVLLGSIKVDGHLVGVRDRAILSVLAYTAARAGAVAALKRGDLYRNGEQWTLHFNEKGNKSREIPVRDDLQQLLFAYLDVAGLRDAKKNTPLFQSFIRKEKRLSGKQIHSNDVCRMMKRRLKDAHLPPELSPHSFRVTVITDLLTQGVPLEDAQRLAGHADPRTTRLYDRRNRKITRNLVERISI